MLWIYGPHGPRRKSPVHTADAAGARISFAVGAPRPREFASKCHRRSAGVYQVALTLCSITGLCSRTGRGAVQPLPQHLWQLQSAPLSAACLRAAAVPGDTTSSTRVELRAHNAAKRRRRRGARTTNLWIADSLLCVIFPPLWAIRGIFLGAELLPAAVQVLDADNDGTVVACVPVMHYTASTCAPTLSA